jgi:CRISPR-associated protein Cas5d
MPPAPPTVSVKVSGEFALFTRPELKVERMSYPLMTPSAARGVLDAILFKPQMGWHVRRITALRPNFPPDFPERAAELPYRLIGIRRNEIQGKIAPRTVEAWIKDPSSFEPYLVDSAGRESAQGQNRTQRNSLALHHVAYLIEATPVLTAKANRPREKPPDVDEDPGPDTVAKYVGMFQRRVAKGQCFHRPYLGCREFACHFAPSDGSELPLTDWNQSLGPMLYDIKFDPAGAHRPGFFQAQITRGVLHCDTAAPGPNGEPPVQVLGWEEVAA